MSIWKEIQQHLDQKEEERREQETFTRAMVFVTGTCVSVAALAFAFFAVSFGMSFLSCGY